MMTRSSQHGWKLSWGKGCFEWGSTWRFFKFRVVGGDVDKSFVHCKLCLDQGNKKRGQIKYCGGTTNLLLLMRIGWKQFFLVMHLYFSFLLPLKDYFANLRFLKINRRLIGAPFWLIVIARQLLLKRFSPLSETHQSLLKVSTSTEEFQKVT